MGIIEINDGQLWIESHLITYGDAATPELTAQIREEIETMWNEPQATLNLAGKLLPVRFRITAAFHPGLSELEVLQNTDPRRNFFRIENFAMGNISFVDGLGCNTGYFLAGNLLPGWTTAAHEYGHTLGLDHPKILDIRGQGRPGIMYPRGTLVDPHFQYDPDIAAGEKGGTMHPMHRRVLQSDIDALQLEKKIRRKESIIGDFTNIYHWNHAGGYDRFSGAPVAG